MRFHLLGPLELVSDDGATVPLPQARLRSLLAVLLINHGSVINTQRLVSFLWEIHAPTGADHAIHSYVSSLRRALRILGPDSKYQAGVPYRSNRSLP